MELSWIVASIVDPFQPFVLRAKELLVRANDAGGHGAQGGAVAAAAGLEFVFQVGDFIDDLLARLRVIHGLPAVGGDGHHRR